MERATSDLLIGPDWGFNLEICDAVNHNPSLTRDVVKALRKRLSNKNAKVQLLALTVLEMVMKNCGDSVHQMVAEKDVLHDMVKIVKKKVDLVVRDKILTLLESWQKAFGGPTAKYSQYSAVYNELQRSGVQFPTQSGADTVPMFTPPAATHSTTVVSTNLTATANTKRSLPHLAYGLPSFPPARLDEVLAASENSVWSSKDLDGARRTLEVLNEMLNVLDPEDKQAVHDDVIVQLVEQCVTNQKIVRQLVNSTSDENIMCQSLTLNDDIQQVLAKHSAILSKASSPAELTPGSPRGVVVYDNEDDEAEDDLSHLAHRSSSRSSRSSQENGLRKSTPYAQPVTMPFTPTTAGGQNFDQGNMPGRNHQLSDEQDSMLNPFANMASIPAYSSNASHSSATVNNGSLESSKLHIPSHHEKTIGEPDSSAYKVPWQIADNGRSSELPSRHQDYTSQASERQQTSHHSASTPFDDDMLNPTSSWSPVAKKKPVSSLPPPPILYTERERFFEEKRQMNQSPIGSTLTSSSMERRMQNLNLSDTNQDQGTHANGSAQTAAKSLNKQVSAPDKQSDRLFEDLVDLRSMRANYKNSGVTSNLSRPKANGAGGM